MIFRIYRTKCEYFDTTKKLILSSDITINLGLVVCWEECDNEENNFEDDKRRTLVHYNNGKIYTVPLSYEQFSAVMVDFLGDSGLLDNRSLPGGKEEIKFAKHHYRGPVKLLANQDHFFMGWSFFPKQARIASPEDAVIQCLFSAVHSTN